MLHLKWNSGRKGRTCQGSPFGPFFHLRCDIRFFLALLYTMGTALLLLRRRGPSHSSMADISALILCASSSTTALLAAQVTSASSSASSSISIDSDCIDRFPHDGEKFTERFPHDGEKFTERLEGLARRREEKTLYGETAEETGSAEKARAAAAATKATKASEQEFVIELEEGELVGE